MELHEGRHVGKAHVVGAGSHAGHRAAGAVAGVHRHIQAGGLEVTFGHGLQEEGGRAFEAPIELELDGGLGVGTAEGQCGGQGGGGLDEVALVHEISVDGVVAERQGKAAHTGLMGHHSHSKKGASNPSQVTDCPVHD